jgi:hypothetical protein
MRNPFVGLRPFDSTEKDLFFGRSGEIAVLKNLVMTVPVLIVYAPSGTGKSSLLNAGLLPLLGGDPGLLPVKIADPQDDVLAEVRKALTSAGWTGGDETAGSALADVLERYFAATSRRVILVLDQFEERLKQGDRLNTLYGQIARLANTRSEAATVIISIREDFLAGLEPLMRRVTGLLDSGYRIPALTRPALTEAVNGPLRAAGGGVSIKANLIDEVLTDLERQTDSVETMNGHVEAGYFQVVWSRLWDMDVRQPGDELTLATYRREGGATKIVESFVSGILSQLLPFEAEVLQAMIRYLVLPTGRKVALTVEDLAGLVRSEDFTYIWRSLILSGEGGTLRRLIGSVFEQLTRSEAPLFRRVIRGTRTEFELVHDLVGKILLNWRLQYENNQRLEAEAVIIESKDEVYTRRSGDRHASAWKSAVQAAEEFLHQYLMDLADLKDTIYQDQARRELITAAAQLAMSSPNRYGISTTLGPEPLKALDRDFSEALERLQSAALKVPSREHARILQLQVRDLSLIRQDERFRYMEPNSGRSLMWRLARGTVLFLASVVAALAGMLSAGWLVPRILPVPRVQYGPLTLSIVTTGAVLIYLAVLSDETSGSRIIDWTALRKMLWPTGSGRWRWAEAIPTSWPVLFLLFVLGCYAGGAIFRLFSWSPTAGFNVAALASAIILGIWYAIETDL